MTRLSLFRMGGLLAAMAGLVAAWHLDKLLQAPEGEGPVPATPPPPQATQLVFTVQPSTTSAGATITPAVEVTAVDDQGRVATGYTGFITVAKGQDGSLFGNGVLSGTTTVRAVNGVARFGDLRIDQPGNGYTLRATASPLRSGESSAFNISVL